MNNSKESTTKMNGRLKEHYNLNLVINCKDTIDNRKKLIVDLYLVHDGDKDSKIELTKKQGVAKIFINNEVVAKENIDIDTKYSKEIKLVSYEEDFLLKNSIRMIIKASLDVNDESKYLENTEIFDVFTLRAEEDRKLFIDLDYNENSTTVFCTYSTTLEPDFLEYKTNFSDWTKLDYKYKNFSVAKEEKDMWIQVRGKYKDEYSYSNTIKIKAPNHKTI